MKAKHNPFPVILDTTGYRLYWNDTEVSEAEYKKLEQEALEYNEKLAREKTELDAPAKRKKKSSTSQLVDQMVYSEYNGPYSNQGYQMSKLLITTQVYENYGSHDWDGEGECPQYWKAKAAATTSS